MSEALNRRIHRPHSQDSGFTLIELLVVIVILGILSAVVVFAVRGVGDKGSGAAFAIDAKTIRTAQEAYCAKNGRYASGEELVAAQFLSELPTYHQTEPAATTPDSNGNCGGAGDPSKASYYIICNATQAGCGNGGAAKVAWTQQNSGITSGTFQDVTFVDTQQGWAVGNAGRIHHTTNGGTTWTIQSSGTAVELFDVDFVDATRGWATGSGFVAGSTQHVILATVDGGATWAPQTNIPASVSANNRFDGMDFIDANRGWIGGDGGLILTTNDGGVTWTEQQPEGPGVWIRTMSFLDATHGWAGGPGGSIYRYDGTTWTPAAVPGGISIFGIKFVNPLKGLAVGTSGFVFATTDGGATWTETHQLGAAGVASTRNAIDFVNDRQGWSVGAGLTSAPARVVATVDGGQTWKAQASTTTGTRQGVDFVDAAHGWAVGTSGQIYKYGPIP